MDNNVTEKILYEIVKEISSIFEALKMAQDLPFLLAFPIYASAYTALAWLVAKAVKAWREALK